MSAVLLQRQFERLDANVLVPPSKSITNRALVAAAVAGGGIVESPLDCDDTRHLARAIADAGWGMSWHDAVQVGPRKVPARRVTLDLGESGTGARLALALAAASPGQYVIDGGGRLRDRPMKPLIAALTRIDAVIRARGDALPAEVDGKVLTGGRTVVRPEVSSQFVSALILAAPLMTKGLVIEVEGELPSAPYLDLTEEVMRVFGARLEVGSNRRTWRIAPQALRPARFAVEGDWSAAAFFVAAVAVAGGAARIAPLERTSRQGDRKIVEILGAAGMETTWGASKIECRGRLTGPFEADLGDTPDLFPALIAVAATVAPGSRFTGLDHLRHKESDRLATMIENLERLGARFDHRGTRLVVTQPCTADRHDPAPAVTAANDHRIAMAMAVAALAIGPITLDDGACVAKSFPEFWQAWDVLRRPSRRDREQP